MLLFAHHMHASESLPCRPKASLLAILNNLE
jgi:hypothetical protein